MALQFRRYRGARIFAFDFGGSIRAAALAMGGDWHDLGGALSGDAIGPVALQPLSAIDDTAERAWAAQWVVAILAREGVTITPEAKEHLWSALGSLASAPRAERTLTGLSVLLQSSALKQALQPYQWPHRLLGDPLARFGGWSLPTQRTRKTPGDSPVGRRQGKTACPSSMMVARLIEMLGLTYAGQNGSNGLRDTPGVRRAIRDKPGRSFRC